MLLIGLSAPSKGIAFNVKTRVCVNASRSGHFLKAVLPGMIASLPAISQLTPALFSEDVERFANHMGDVKT